MSSEAVDVKGSKSHRATPGEWSEEIIAEEDGDIACTNRVFECSERGWDMDETYRQSTLYCLHVSFLFSETYIRTSNVELFPSDKAGEVEVKSQDLPVGSTTL
jgi:hypothetical protein